MAIFRQSAAMFWNGCALAYTLRSSNFALLMIFIEAKVFKLSFCTHIHFCVVKRVMLHSVWIFS